MKQYLGKRVRFEFSSNLQEVHYTAKIVAVSEVHRAVKVRIPEKIRGLKWAPVKSEYAWYSLEKIEKSIIKEEEVQP